MDGSVLQIVGLGNPLLDYVATISPSLLVELGVSKGHMTLSDERSVKVFDFLKAGDSKHVFGDVKYLPGGSTMNTMRTIQGLAPSSGFAGMIGGVGDDADAETLRAQAKEEGLVPMLHKVSGGVKTGTCGVLVTEDKERTLVTSLAAATGYREAMLHDGTEAAKGGISALKAIQKVKYAYSSCFFLDADPVCMMIMGEKLGAAKDGIFAINLGGASQVDRHFDRMLEVLAHADIIIGNEDEWGALCTKLGSAGDLRGGMKICIDKLPKKHTYKLRILICTRGADGIYVEHSLPQDGSKTDPKRIPETDVYPAIPIDKNRIVDTNGAGDAWAGGFLFAHMKNLPFSECVQLGNRCASLMLTVPGFQLEALVTI